MSIGTYLAPALIAGGASLAVSGTTIAVDAQSKESTRNTASFVVPFGLTVGGTIAGFVAAFESAKYVDVPQVNARWMGVGAGMAVAGVIGMVAGQANLGDD